MTRITCPHCGRTSSSSKTIPPGSTVKVKCPACGQGFRIDEQGLELLEVLPTKAVSPSRVEPVEVASRLRHGPPGHQAGLWSPTSRPSMEHVFSKSSRSPCLSVSGRTPSA